ncbi:MAG: hypothetical protein ABSB60_13640 [Terracidiphilus sp.]|jgi:uncharacterized membrane protein
MIASAEDRKSIDAYLAALRRQLRDLLDEDAKDIVEEIRAHILDKSSADRSADTVAATLAALGTPEELATRYRTEELLRRAQMSRSPVVIMRNLLRWGALTLAGVSVFLISVAGYCLGGFLFLIATLKVIWPRGTGLSKTVNADGSWGLGLGFSNQPMTGHELLGWWLLPIGFVFGTGLIFLTFRFGLWSLRKFWRPRAWG